MAVPMALSASGQFVAHRPYMVRCLLVLQEPLQQGPETPSEGGE